MLLQQMCHTTNGAKTHIYGESGHQKDVIKTEMKFTLQNIQIGYGICLA